MLIPEGLRLGVLKMPKLNAENLFWITPELAESQTTNHPRGKNNNAVFEAIACICRNPAYYTLMGTRTRKPARTNYVTFTSRNPRFLATDTTTTQCAISAVQQSFTYPGADIIGISQISLIFPVILVHFGRRREHAWTRRALLFALLRWLAGFISN